MDFYFIPLIEVLSLSEKPSAFNQNPDTWVIGFYYLSKEQKALLLREILEILDKPTEDSLAKLPDIVKKLIAFFAITDKSKTYLAKSAKLPKIIEDEDYLLKLLPSVIIFLRDDARLPDKQAILDRNLEHFLEYAVAKQKETPKLLSESKAFKVLIKTDSTLEEDEQEPTEELLLWDAEGPDLIEDKYKSPFHNGSSQSSSDEALFLELKYIDQPWEYLLLQDDKFPLFEKNLQSLDIQKTISNFCTEFGLAENITLELKKAYRPEQDLLAYLRHTTICQNLLRTFRENSKPKSNISTSAGADP